MKNYRKNIQTGNKFSLNIKKMVFRTSPNLSNLTLKKKQLKKISRAAIETLAIIVYHQPVTRAEIEEIRGHLALITDILMELNWVNRW